MAKQPTTQDDLAEMAFPSGGLELTHPSLMGRPDTTPVAENVRYYEPLTGRGRGGSRPGIDPFIAEQVSGEHEIQHIATIVTVDAEMLDYSFDGPNQEFPGIYGGIGFIEFDLNLIGPFDFPAIPSGGPGETFVGGSGYAPKDPKKKTTLELSVDDNDVTISDTPLLTITLVDGDRNPFTLPNKTVYIFTDPPGEVPDGTQTTVVGSETQLSLSATEPKTIRYFAKAVSVRGAVVAESNTIKVKWRAGNTVIAWSTPAPITVGTALSSTQLNAVAGVPSFGTIPGTYTYTPPIGTVLALGNAQTLHVDFVPTDNVSFSGASKSVLIDVTTGGGPDVPDIACFVTGNADHTVTVTSIPGEPFNSAANIALAASLVGLPVTVFYVSGVEVLNGEGSLVGAVWNTGTLRWEY